MHIMEGFLPLQWCILWFIISIIVIIIGIIQWKRLVKENPEAKKILAINGIVMFFVSAFNLPALEGNGSNPLANGLPGSIFGPAITSVVVAIVLILQAFILAYGGLTTLGANIFSMGIAGPFAAYIAYTSLNKINCPDIISLILAVFIANVVTTATTALQIALVFSVDFFADLYKFFIILGVTQVIFVVIDIIVAVILFVILKSVYKDSKLFSPESNDFLKIK